MRKGKSILFAVSFVVLTLIFQGVLVAQEEKKININTALLEELVLLKRVGDAYAQRIIDYREKNGPFEKIEDIMKVPGIGVKTFESNKDRIIVE